MNQVFPLTTWFDEKRRFRQEGSNPQLKLLVPNAFMFSSAKCANRGLKWISKHRRVRMCALGDSLARLEYDIICLQECWVLEDFQYIQRKVRHFLPYSHYYFAGFLGSGLANFSRWPIVSTSMFPFGLSGRPAAFWRGDWFAGKGVATALLRHESGTLIEVFNTHVSLILICGLISVSRAIWEG